MQRSKFTLLSAVLIFLLVLAGCGSSQSAGTSGSTGSSSGSGAGSSSSSGSGSSSSASGTSSSSGSGSAAASSGQKVTLRFSWWGDPQRNKVYDGVISAFEQQYPNITVKGEPVSWGDYWNKLSTEVAGGNAPDVIGMHANYVGDYAGRGVLTDLGPYIKDGTIDMTNFPQSVQDTDMVNGKTVMVTQGVALMSEVYNKTLLDKLGVPAPDVNWTWDDFFKEATAVRDAFKKNGQGSGHWGADDQSTSLYPGFQYFLRQHGKQLYTADGQLGFTKDDLVAWFTMWDKARKAGIIPDAATSAQYANAAVPQTMFAKGLIGISSIPANQLYLYQDQMKDSKLNIVRIPTLAGGKNGEMVAGAYLSIWTKSKHPKEAAEFINFFVNNPAAGKIFKEEQGVPGSTKIDQVIKPLLEPAQQIGLQFVEDNLKYASGYPYPPKGSSQINTNFTNDAQAVAYGKMSIDQAAQKFMDDAKTVLK